MPLRKILFVGKPGVGKGTQANLLVPYGFKTIGTGEIIREAFRREDPLVMPYRAGIEAGGFLPDEEIFMLIDREIGKIGEAKGYILDGAIRNLAQAEIALQRGLIEEGLFFYLCDEEAMRRIGMRYSSEGRKDDSPGAVEKRLLKYGKDTRPIVEYLEAEGIKFHHIDAHPAIGKVHRRTLEALKLR